MGNTNKPSVISRNVSAKRHIDVSLNNKTSIEFLMKIGQFLQKKSFEEEGKDGITKSVFKNYLCKASEGAATALFEYFLIQEGILIFDVSTGNEDNFVGKSENLVIPKEKFIKQASVLLNCFNETQQLEYYIKVFCGGREEITHKHFANLIGVSYEIAQFVNHTAGLPDDVLLTLSKAVMNGKDRTDCKSVLNWCCENCPRMVMSLHQYLSHNFTVGYSSIIKNEETEEVGNEKPVLDYTNKSSCLPEHPELLWMLSCSLPLSFIKGSTPNSPSLERTSDSRRLLENLMMEHTPSHWVPLFNTNEHGMSNNRFKHHVFDYHGPTIIFIKADEKALFCIACDEEWRDSVHFFGGCDSICMQLLPEYKVIERGRNLLFFNNSSKGFPMCFQIGTDQRSRALVVDLSSEHMEFKRIPFKLLSLQVWGCGTSEAQELQQDVKKQAIRDVDGARKVKRPGAWKDNPDRHILEMGGTRADYGRFDQDTQNIT